MNIKKHLRQYEFAKLRAKALRSEIFAAEEAIDCISSSNDGMPRSGKISKITEANAIKIADAKREYLDVLTGAEVARIELLQDINLLGDEAGGKYAAIVKYKHLDLMTFAEIGDEMGLSAWWCERLYAKGIERLKEILENDKRET